MRKDYAKEKFSGALIGRKLLSLILILVLTVGILPIFTAPVESATASQLIEKRLKELKALDGHYFTTDNKKIPGTALGPDLMEVLNSNPVIRSLNLKNKGGYPEQDSIPGHYSYRRSDNSYFYATNGWQCSAFANYGLWYVAAANATDYVTSYLVTKGKAFTYANASKYLKPGDAVRIDGYVPGYSSSMSHSFIVIKVNRSNVEVIDANTATNRAIEGTNKIKVHTYSYSSQAKITVTRATKIYDGSKTIRRLSGENRYDTALKIADAYKADSGKAKFDSIIVACGTNFPDALAGSYLAKAVNAPIIIWREKENRKIQDYIKSNVKSGGKVYLLGGTGAISDNIKTGMGKYKFVRLSGDTRYETNISILQAAGFKGGEILVVDSRTFQTALIASATGKPILLVNESNLRSSQIRFLESLGSVKFTIIGNTQWVSNSIAKALKKYGTVTRIKGDFYDELSVKVAEKYFKNPTKLTLAIVDNFPDGLCGGPLCILNQEPILLVYDLIYDTPLSDHIRRYRDKLKIKQITVLGGTALISNKTASIIGNF